MSVRMGWNPEAPTNGLRMTLLSYLEAQLRDLIWTLEKPPGCACDLWQRGYCRQGCPGEKSLHDPARVEVRALRRWIHWLEGRSVSVADLGEIPAPRQA